MNLRAVRSLRGGLIVAGATVIVATAVVGTALAARPSPPAAGPAAASAQPEHWGRFMEVVAGKLGITSERLRQAFTEARQELGGPADHHRGRFGDRQERGGPDGHHRGRFGAPVRGIIENGLRVAAEAIGISPEDLRRELPGNSLAGVARTHGVDPQRVSAALTTSAHARIDAGAAAGRITQEQAARIKERASAMVERLMTRELPTRPPAGRRGSDT